MAHYLISFTELDYEEQPLETSTSKACIGPGKGRFEEQKSGLMSATGDPPSPDTETDGDLTGSHQANLIACAVVTWVIAASFVALRFYTRRWLIHVLGTEDWTILGALTFSALTSGFIITGQFNISPSFQHRGQ